MATSEASAFAVAGRVLLLVAGAALVVVALITWLDATKVQTETVTRSVTAGSTVERTIARPAARGSPASNEKSTTTEPALETTTTRRPGARDSAALIGTLAALGLLAIAAGSQPEILRTRRRSA